MEEELDALMKGLFGAGGAPPPPEGDGGGAGESGGEKKEEEPGVDPRILFGLMELLGEAGREGDGERLLSSLRPFMSAERAGKVDEAIRLMKLLRAAKGAAKLFGDYDLIFCGKESLDGATGQMGSQLAERFDASQLSSMSLLLKVDEEARTVTAERELEKGTETAEAKLPCLFTVEKTNYRPRIPNLRSWKASRTAEITKLTSLDIPGLDPAQIGDPGSPTKVPRTYPPVVGESGHMIDEGSTEKNVETLFELIADVL